MSNEINITTKKKQGLEYFQMQILNQIQYFLIDEISNFGLVKVLSFRYKMD